jgi:hypothetical protein
MQTQTLLMATTSDKPETTRPRTGAVTDSGEKATLYWSLMMVGVFIVCSLLGVLMQRLYQGSSLAESARIAKKCRFDPSFNPVLCAQVLNDETIPKMVRDRVRGKQNQRAVFQLYSDDEDLTPPPGLGR